MNSNKIKIIQQINDIKQKSLIENFEIDYFNHYCINQIEKDLSVWQNIKNTQQQIDGKLVFQKECLGEKKEGEVFLNLYFHNLNLTLSDIINILASFGIKVNSYHSFSNQKENLILHEFFIEGIEFNSSLKDNPEKQQNFFDNLFNVLIKKNSPNRFNILSAIYGLNTRHIQLLQTFLSHFRQINKNFDQNFIDNLIKNQHYIFSKIIDFFEERFNPELQNPDNNYYEKQILQSLINTIENSTEFNFFETFFSFLNSIVRTNFFQNKEYISLKIKPILIEEIETKGIFAEIFVFHPNIEGLHLRGGKAARGGIRWSDRPQDYRMEVFELMKAQVKKNSIIIPTGAKGGFVIKTQESDRQKIIKYYKIFIQGLLDITDNLDNQNKIIRDTNIVIPQDLPENILNEEKEDYYLVVAADKGTASFSDYANEISNQYNFWLGDAFASGGKNGYDHKKLAITSKGAWISVEKLFAEINIDIQTETFSVIGIGDMAGDVFGNGMLRSSNIKLIAAFNHQHIFIDPNPDPIKSFQERKRLFELKNSTWQDYNQSIISAGGGIYKLSEKFIKISSQAAQALNIEENDQLEFTPDQLKKHILQAKVDLLFNGGIGTFVKSSSENHADAADRNNDNVRINGSELRVKVVVEGGNLGFTQKGRIEYTENGGQIIDGNKIAKINTDFIDNSAGVSCSDREVNIKITLQSALKNNKINLEQRNKILEQMSDNVCHLVLKDNFLQNNSLMLEEYQSNKKISWHRYLINKLEELKILDRNFEDLRSDKQIEELCEQNKGISRPELCILLSYSKIWLKREINNSVIAKNPYFEKFLIGYFPKPLQEQFKEEILSHPLKYEIITNYIVNTIINRIGINFVLNLMEKSGINLENIIYAYFIIRDSYKLRMIWHNVEYDYQFTNIQSKIISLLEIRKYATYALSRFLRLHNYNLQNMQNHINNISEKIDYSIKNFNELLPTKSFEYYQGKCIEYKDYKFESDCSNLLSKISALIFIPSIIQIVNLSGCDFDYLIKIYFLIEEELQSREIRRKIALIRPDGIENEISTSILADELANQHNCIMNFILNNYIHKCNQPQQAIELWKKDFHIFIENYKKIAQKFLENKNFDYAVVIIILNRIRLLYKQNTN